ncbi:MAG: hypothetical protein U0R24_04665 [Solirubrobacterales bacterium]
MKLRAKLPNPLRTSILLLAGPLVTAAVIFPGAASAASPNDDFGSPRVIPPGLGSNNSSYTAQAGEPAHAGVPANHSIWFRFENTASTNRTVQVDTCGSATDTVISAYEAAPDFAGLVSLAEDDDAAAGDPGCTPGDSKISFTAAAGTSYLFALDSKFAASPGSFQFIIRAQPPNANFADAVAIPGTSGSATEVNFFAGAEAGEPAHAGSPAANSAWYSFTSAGTGTVAVDACDSLFDTRIAVYTGSAVNALTPVASNDDSAGCGLGGTASRVEFPAAAGQTYRIAVDGKTASDVGQFHIDVAGPPTNDLFANAEDLGATVATETSGDSAHAGTEPSEPAIQGDPAANSVWYRWTAPQSGPVRIDTCGSDFDTMLAVYTGSIPAALSEVASNDDDTTLPTCDNGDSLVSFTVAEGQTYAIAVDGKAGASGFLHLALVAKPLNDDFADATLLDGTSDFGSGFTTLAGGEPGEPQHGGVGSGHSLWFSWTAPVGGLVELSTCTNDVDPVLAVYTGSAVNALTQVVADDDAGSPDCSPQDSAVSFAATAGTTYRIAADAVSGAGRIEVTLARPADTTAPDTTVTGGPSAAIATTSATFTYEGSPAFDVAAFECSLDGAAFAVCPTSGKELTGLSEGPHSFAVRAVDFDGNADPTPASRHFTVAVDHPAPDCTAAETRLARAKTKLKRAKAALRKARGAAAGAKAKARVKRAKAKVRSAKDDLASCRG